MEIARPLVEYLQMKSAAEALIQRNLLGEHTFIRQVDRKDLPFDLSPQMVRVGLFELIDAFREILDNISKDQVVDLTADRMPMRSRACS